MFARAMHDMVLESARTGNKGFDFVEGQSHAKGADMACKEPKFRPSKGTERLAGFAPEMGVYV